MNAIVASLLVLLLVREVMHYHERKIMLRALLASEPGDIDKAEPRKNVRMVNTIRRNIKAHESRIRERY